MKTCRICKIEKPITAYSKAKTNRDGLVSMCKSCKSDYSKKYLADPVNKAKVKAYKDRYYADPECREKIRAYQSEYYADPEIKARELVARAKRLSNPDKREAHRAWCRANDRRRREKDPLFRLECNLRSRIRSALKAQGYKKTSRTFEILGSNYLTVSQHLINTAVYNYGTYDSSIVYEIDHIIPCSSAKTEEELVKLQHYTNLQYLLPYHNRTKADKLDWSLHG